MLFDLGWSEILLIGTVALVFIGPKDLPKAMRVAGYWIRKARTLSREFQSSIDQMIREAELDEMRQDLKKATEFDLEKEFHNTIDPTGNLSESLKLPELPNFSGAEPMPLSAVDNDIEGTARLPVGPVHAPQPAAVEPVPMIACPESEPDAVEEANPAPPVSPPAESDVQVFVPPKP